jgi:hypothetical protein
MGMSTHIQAFIPDTDKVFNKHKKVLLACLEAQVSLPKETAEYFGEEEPEIYLLDNKLSVDLEEGNQYTEWYDGYGSQGFEVDLSKLPPAITKLRFYNNW